MLKMLFAAFLTLLIASVSAQAQTTPISSEESKKCLEAGILDIIQGDPVLINPCNKSPRQRWEISSGLTEIKLPIDNFCVDAVDVDNPHVVVISECNLSQEQQWVFTEDGFLVLANNTDLCLEEPSSASGVQVQTAGCNDGLNQMWNLALA